ncbi:MAG: hypothetical protein KIG14_02100 [Candidatus Sacchiramonaceae bacterium]|nr:hypothetical protein [Candidatus Saccharimonadaceae bacterium]
MFNKIKAKFLERTGKAQKNQFAAFVTLSICVAGGLMWLSLWLYNESGAAQLDLSRPSYQAAREASAKEEKAEKDNQAQEDFASDGDVDEKALKEFKEIYRSRLDKIKANAFRTDPLSDDSLHILDDSEE